MEDWERKIKEFCVQHGYLSPQDAKQIDAYYQQSGIEGQGKDLVAILARDFNWTDQQINTIYDRVVGENSKPNFQDESLDFSINSGEIVCPTEETCLDAGISSGSKTSVGQTFVDENLNQTGATVTDNDKIEVPVGNDFAEPTAETFVDLKSKIQSPGPRKSVEKFGRYEITKVLGEGGMGRVYLAIDPKLDREIALKVILAQGYSGDEIKRFEIEAKATAKLRHPNIVGIHDYGEQNGQCFFAMEYVKGETLQDAMRDQKWPMTKYLETLKKMVGAMGYAHERKVVHRDLKPANVIVEENGEPHIMDFGLAKMKDKDSKDPGLTQDGTVMGSPYYMSPEQAEGRVDEIEAATDIYSLGVILYEVMTGTKPFSGPTINNIIVKIITQEAEPPKNINPDVHEELQRICQKAMAKEKKDRYENAYEMANDLENYIQRYCYNKTQQCQTPVKNLPEKTPLLEKLPDDTSETPIEEPAPRSGEKKSQPLMLAVIVILLVVVGYLVLENKFPIKNKEDNPKVGTNDKTNPNDSIVNSVNKNNQNTTDKNNQNTTDKNNQNTTDKKSQTPIEKLEGKGWFGEELISGIKPKQRGEYIWHKDNSVMVYVPEGEFFRGDEEKEDATSSLISLPAFYIDKYEITIRQYKIFSKKTGKKVRWKTTAKHPVVNIHWQQLNAYARWAGKRLPTETQWEKAARGGLKIPDWDSEEVFISLLDNNQPKRVFPNGDSLNTENKYTANYDGYESDDGSDHNYYKKDGYEYTAPVGSFPQGTSPYGCLDMAGNVWEWCEDWYSKDHYKQNTINPPGSPKNGKYKVIRGGSWYNSSLFCQTSQRFRFAPNIKDDGIGGRLVK